MANQEQLDILKQGVDVWNRWRREHTEIQLDLSFANLNRIDLLGVPLFGANLEGANLTGADLTFTYLTRAELEGTNLTEASLTGADLARADLTGADLARADLTGANLARADLSFAKLEGTNLTGANLARADLSFAKLEGTNLTGANLTGTNLTRTNLTGANLSEADLSFADLTGANLTGADLSKTTMRSTTLANVDLSITKSLEAVKQNGPSSIGIDTIYRSQGKIPEYFLQDAGVPESFLTYMHSLIGQAIQYFTCFISHSHHDQRFCDRLYADLRHHDVPSWYFPEDATWGKTVWGEIDRSIKVYDKLVVVCSEHSLKSPAVQREIERALQREDREGKNILFPIRIDNYLFQEWEHERKSDVVNKIAGDFRGWRNADKYDKVFQKFLKGLKAIE
jgi:uncharacterized protein YjbI with pentapeptide repeats